MPKKQITPAEQLYEAVLYGRLKEIKQLLTDGVDPNGLWEGKPPLIAATGQRTQQVEAARLLLDAGADPNLEWVQGFPLDTACSMSPDAVEMVQLLLSAGADPNSRRYDNSTALMSASGWGNVDVIQSLLDGGADPALQDDTGKTALVYAQKRFNHAAIALLQSVTVPSESSERPWRSSQAKLSGGQRLVEAAKGGDAEYVRQLLDDGADVNFSDNVSTPLNSAAENGHLDVVELLLVRGANIEGRDSTGFTPLINAAQGEKTDLVKRLLAAGADINAKAFSSGSNALHYCVDDGNVELVQVLIDAGIDVNLKNESFRYTPLHVAVENAYRIGHSNTPAILELLVKAGADISVIRTKKDKIAPIHRAMTDLPSVKKLLELGADPNQADGDGKTPLMYAAEIGADHVKVLLEAGADPRAVDKKGRTALDYAKEAKRTKAATLLKAAIS